VVADAFTASARTKIEAAGGAVSVLEVPTSPLKALGIDPADGADSTEAEPAEAPPAKATSKAPKAAKAPKAKAAIADAPEADPLEASEPPAAVADVTTDETAADASVDEVETAPGDDA
jgi:hypothetical protein